MRHMGIERINSQIDHGGGIFDHLCVAGTKKAANRCFF